jgi:pimeloyl-ACP methyl ester carboxylesterase
VILAGLPTLLLIVALIASLTHRADVARSSFRGLRYVLTVELVGLAVLASVGAIYEKVSSDRARRLHPMPGKLLEVGGYRLHLYCTGDGGPTVVLAYGMSGSYLDWYLVQPQVAKFTRVCSYDRPGYGWSELSPKPRVPSVHAEELHALLEKAGEKPPYILVGHSLGAFDVLMYAHHFPEQVAGVVLVDGAHPEWNISFGSRDRLEMRLLQITAPLGLPRWRKWCLQGPPEVADQKRAFNCQSHIFEANYQLRNSYRRAAEEIRTVSSIGNIPLVVISRDPNRPRISGNDVANEQRWARLQADFLGMSSNSSHVIAEGSGHAVPLERPEVIVEQVRKLIEAGVQAEKTK